MLNSNIYYDVSLDEQGFRIDLFKEKIVNKKVNNHIESFRFFDLISSYYTNNIPEDILKLKQNNCINGSKLVPETYDGVIINNALTKLKLILLSNKIKVLEKVYLDTIIDNMNYTITYLTYINLDTGLIEAIYLGNIGLHNDNKINELINNGYIYIKDSMLYHHLNELENRQKLILNKK